MNPRAARCLLKATVVLLGDKLSVPFEQSFGSDDRHDLAQRVNAGLFCLGREAPPLVVGKARLPTKLLAQNPDFLLKVLDQALLALIHAPRQKKQTKLQKAHLGLSVGLSSVTLKFLDSTGFRRVYRHFRAALRT